MSDERRPADLLRERAKTERRLLRAEQAAERNLLAAQERLTSAQLKLDKAQARIDRRRKRVAAALDALRSAQSARATGPETQPDETLASESNRQSQPLESGAPPESEAATAMPERDDTGLPPRALEIPAADDDEPSDPRPTRRRKRRSESSDQT